MFAAARPGRPQHGGAGARGAEEASWPSYRRSTKRASPTPRPAGSLLGSALTRVGARPPAQAPVCPGAEDPASARGGLHQASKPSQLLCQSRGGSGGQRTTCCPRLVRARAGRRPGSVSHPAGRLGSRAECSTFRSLGALS